MPSARLGVSDSHFLKNTNDDFASGRQPVLVFGIVITISWSLRSILASLAFTASGVVMSCSYCPSPAKRALLPLSLFVVSFRRVMLTCNVRLLSVLTFTSHAFASGR